MHTTTTDRQTPVTWTATHPAATPSNPRTPRWRRVHTVSLALAAIALALTGTTLFAGAVAKARLATTYPPIGQLVDVGGYRLHLVCQGSGSPTVLLDAGAGGFSLQWARVQPALATTTRVCAYDRAGLGWSDRSPRPRTAPVMAEELATLLARAHIDGPYVLVGHSLGGAVVRQFAAAHPAAVVGMVLIDSATEQQVQRFPASIRNAAGSQLRALRVLQLAASTGILALKPSLLPLATTLPAETATTIQALVASSGKVLTTFGEEVDAVNHDTTPRVTTVGNIPLVVIRHGRADLQPSGTVTQADIAQYETTWIELQQDLATLSPRGKLIVAERSGHDIHLEQPELVIDAIQDVLAPRS